MISDSLNTYRTLKETAMQLETLKKKEVFDCGDGVYESIVSDAEQSDFEALYAGLKELSGGGILWDRTVAGNRFCGIRQDAGYTALSYLPVRRQIRILCALHGEPAPEDLGDRPHYCGPKTVTQVCPDDSAGNFGMCYVFALGEGHFLVYDGNGDEGNDHEKLYRCLTEGVEDGKKPVVDAWIVTHPHWDHVAGLCKFAKQYHEAVEIRNLLFNFPSPSIPYFYKDIGNLYFSRECWLKGFFEAYPETKCYKIHTGQCFSVGDARVEVLYTHEDLYPCEELRANDASSVTMVTVNGKKLFFPADITCTKACTLLRDLYGAELKSDYYQVAHHGWDTDALIFYPLVDAPNVLWPLRKRDWEKIQKYPATQVLAQELREGRRKFYIAWEENHTIEL